LGHRHAQIVGVLGTLFGPDIEGANEGLKDRDNCVMDTLLQLLDFVLHVDRYLQAFVENYGMWVYALLFLIIFVETGLVVVPFLPGDSLLFVVGTLCGSGLLNLPLVMGLLVVAAISGDQVNYRIGSYFGPKVFQWENSRFFNRAAFDKAHNFYETYGGITIVLARFMPFIRTFVPFVAGVAAMTPSRFLAFNVMGGLIWVCGLTSAGYLFGETAFVQAHLSQIIWAMIFVPGLFALWGAWRARQS
jgi:membrane-associated protein